MKVSTSLGPHWQENEQNLGCNIYHSIEWSRTLPSDHQHPLFFSWFEGEQCIGFAIGIKRWSHVPVAGRFLNHLNLESYPIVKDNSPLLLREMLGQLLNYAKIRGYLTLSINSYLSDYAAMNFDQMGYLTAQRLEFSIDLTKPEDALINAFATRHKRKLKKAVSHKLVFKEAETMEAIGEFRKLQVQSRDRRIQKGEAIGTLEDSYYEKLGRSYFKEKLGRVFFMTHDDHAISTAFISFYGGKAYYTYGGSSDQGFEMDAPTLLFVNIFNRCRELGCTEFNFGGVPASAAEPISKSHGLYLFKAGFGGREIKCYNLYADPLQPGLNTLMKFVRKIRHRGDHVEEQISQSGKRSHIVNP